MRKEYKYMKDLEQFKEDLDTEISFEFTKDPYSEWTKDYKDGFVDGLKRAKELLEDLN